MKFADYAKIYVRSGSGGAGSVSWRREKYIEFGGPDGGNGGKGGDIYVKGNSGLYSLYDLKLNPHKYAKNAQAGGSRKKTGKDGASLTIQVPLGVAITDLATNTLITEVLDSTTQLLVKGGRGGFGNAHFKSSTNRAPKISSPGQPGEELTLGLELKVLADIGLVGLPNAGKSSLINVLSQAKSKVASYPFTTINPQLGVVQAGNYHSFVVADIPGIIENAALGSGLGHKFLKHILRADALALLIDVSTQALLSPQDSYHILINELAQYDQQLLKKEMLVIFTKIDQANPKYNLSSLENELNQAGIKFIAISSHTNQGLEQLINLFKVILKEDRA